MESKTPLQMEDFGIKELNLKWSNPLEEGSQALRNIEVGYEIAQSGAPEMFRIEMTFQEVATLSTGNAHYALSVRCLGFFRFDPALEAGERPKFALNGLAMLYSSLRGALLGVSGVFPPGFRYMLPTVNLHDIVREVEAKRKAQAEAAEALQVREAEPQRVAPSRKHPSKKKQ